MTKHSTSFKYKNPFFKEMATYTAIIQKDEEGWFVSEVVELPGCHTQAKTMDQLIERTKEAIQAYLGEEKNPSRRIQEFVKVQKLEV